jgi:LysM repeat protein
MIADVIASARQPVSDEAIRKGRIAAGALALGGAAAVLFGFGDAAEAKSAQKPASPKSQVIRSGDTLSHIAAKHGVSVEALAAANGLKPNATIYSGRSLVVPTSGTVRSNPATVPAKSYVVKRGDTLSHIAANHGVSVSSLAAANNLSTKSIIVIGRKLTIPGVADSSPAAATVSKTAKSGGKVVVPSDMPASDPRWKLRAEFKAAAKTYGVPQSLLEAMTWNESGWQNHVTSGVGARGIGQIMPGTARHINEMAGTKLDANKTSDNIKMSAIYLKYLIKENNGDYKMALASYYQGLGSVRSIGLYDDTKQYITTITALQRNYFQ